MKQTEFREKLIARLAEDLIGPGAEDERLTTRPTDVYLSGILFPQESELRPEEDESLDRGGGEASIIGTPAETEEAVPLVSTLKPSSAGTSFCVELADEPTISVEVSVGTYRLDETDPENPTWARSQHVARVVARVPVGVEKHGLAEHGIPGAQLFIQGAQWDANRRTVTVALVNLNPRGDTRNESEERTLFQAHMTIRPEQGTRLVARPSRRTAQDDDERAGELIYRHAREHATGHTCATDWDEADGVVTEIRTTWLPQATVPAVSPDGDDVFAAMRSEDVNRLSATWLAAASPEDLAQALRQFVTCYRNWIDGQGVRVADLAPEHQEQARRHMERCLQAATRMQGSCVLIERDGDVREAFQRAQRAMVLQREWATGDADLFWRPFQLGFQLLVLASLADGEHSDRGVMDLLWFPTGGGKTEAYLALTAFLLFARRIRTGSPDEGAGVAVIMRYTLRLLTVQQFQRAATMVCACELLRR